MTNLVIDKVGSVGVVHFRRTKASQKVGSVGWGILNGVVVVLIKVDNLTSLRTMLLVRNQLAIVCFDPWILRMLRVIAAIHKL